MPDGTRSSSYLGSVVLLALLLLATGLMVLYGYRWSAGEGTAVFVDRFLVVGALAGGLLAAGALTFALSRRRAKEEDRTLRVNLWSGPRNASTALMYSFAERPDVRVVDEPLYAHYLRVTGAEHPDREKVLASMESDGRRVVEDVILGRCDRDVLFLKQMAHHLVDLDREWLLDTTNVFLVRDPEEMLPSLAANLPSPTLADTGLPVQVELLEEFHARGIVATVIDATELLLDPPGVLRTLCHRLGIPFEPAMLEWKAGPRPEDGVWAPHWYGGVHASTGFRAWRPKSTPFPPALERLLAECRPLYDRLRAEAIEARPEAER